MQVSASRRTRACAPRLTRLRTEVLAGGALLLLTVLGLLDVVVVLPRVLAPSVPLPQVRAAVAALGDLVPVLIGPAVWGLLGLASAARHLTRGRLLLTRRPGAVVLVEAGALAVLQQAAAFGPGLWLSNHLPPFEGGTTGVGDSLLLLGAVAVVTGALLLAAPAVLRRARPSAAR